MENITNTINQFSPYIFGGMAIIILLLFIAVIVLFRSMGSLENKYRRLMRGASGKNIEGLINSKLQEIEEANKSCEDSKKYIEQLEEKIKGCTQKIAIARYKAFEDVGSDLSFSIAILDGNNDGIVLTGIYSRQGSTTYAKPIDKGISRYDLSEEEIDVLNQAMNK